MTTHLVSQPAHDEAQATFSVVLDLSQHPRAHADYAIGSIVAECGRADLQLLFIVSEPMADLSDNRVTFVEAGAEFDAVERLSLALQLVTAERALVASTSVELRAEIVDQVDELLRHHDLVDVDMLTVPSDEHGSEPFQSSRTVVIGVRMPMYVELRGLDLRIRTARDGADDLARRVRAWEGTVGALRSPDMHAIEPETIEKVAPQAFDTTKARGVFVNLPRWKYRPFTARPSICIIRMGHRSVAPFEGAEAQSLDGYEAIDLACDPADQERAMREHLAALGSRIVAMVAPGAAVPPWRLLEQIQHLRTARTYCVGRAALADENGIQLLSNGTAAQPLVSPTVADLGTVMGRADVLLELIGEGAGLPTTRAQSSKIVSCLSPVHMPARATPATLAEASTVAPYLDQAGSMREHAIVFDQFTVGKVDYIDAYTRLGSIAVLLDGAGTPRREITAVLDPTQTDVDALAAEGLTFSLVSLDQGVDATGIVLQELLGKHAGGPADLIREESPVMRSTGVHDARPAHLFIREGTGHEAWFRLDRTQTALDDKISREWRKNVLELDQFRWVA